MWDARDTIIAQMEIRDQILMMITVISCTGPIHKVTTPQDARKRLVLQVYLGSNTLEFIAIHK